jgi:hypothetical protein
MLRQKSPDDERKGTKPIYNFQPIDIPDAYIKLLYARINGLRSLYGEINHR